MKTIIKEQIVILPPSPDNSSPRCEPCASNGGGGQGREARSEASHQDGELGHSVPYEQDHPPKPTFCQLCGLLQDRKQSSCLHELQSSGKETVQHPP